MPDDAPMEFLQKAAVAGLERAVAENHCEFFALKAIGSGGEVHREQNVTWTFAGPQGDSMILFPRFTRKEAGTRIDAMVRYYLDRKSEDLVGCWSLAPPSPPDLEIRLLARGFQLGWQPCWMSLDMEKHPPEAPAPDGIRIDQVVDETDWDASDLPYYSSKNTSMGFAASRVLPQRAWRFGAWSGDRPVGHSTVCLSTGKLGVAGIYNVGVVPAYRNRGIGRAITVAACRHARSFGCRYALLNATGERMYRQAGFVRIGYGRTWWLDVPRLERCVPTPERIALAEAVGIGGAETLEALHGGVVADELNTPLPNRMTFVQLALHAGRRDSAEWLANRGAVVDLVSAWDLGWKERIPGMIAANPGLVDLCVGENQATALHVAVERNDLELARLALEANPDLSRGDGVYRSTPLGWAKFFQRTELVALIESRLAQRRPDRPRE